MTAPTSGSGSRGNEEDVLPGGGGSGSLRGGASRPSGGGGGGAASGANAAARPLGAILAALVLGLVLGAGGMAIFDKAGDGGGDQFAGVIDEARYQAVILTNDKVYFGQIESVSDEFFELKNAFFLRETRENADAEPVRALLPVNREIHVPDNTMLIRKAEVVLVENLAKDSPILEEIKRQKG
jgi:hypothetical protein